MYGTIIMVLVLTIIIVSLINSSSDNSVIEGFGYNQGPSGTVGPIGPTGTIGPIGPQGQPGPMGANGPSGPVGPGGPRGDSGPKGNRGVKGSRGFDGFPGPRGPIGPRGDVGQVGPKGIIGESGRDGKSGKSGPRGWPGLKGDPGTFGEGSCKFFGSDEIEGWRCPDSYPIYTGATTGSHGSKMYCNGGLARNATCNGSSGSGAIAKVFINKGKITDIKIISGGRNYKRPPYVRVIGQGYGAILKSQVSGGILTEVDIIDAGQDYKKTPEIQFETVDSGYGASAESIIDNGRLVAINVAHTGQNYQVPPKVSLRSGGGQGAKAVAELNDGHVVSIRVVQNGSGYTYPPIVIITPLASKTGCNYSHMCCKKTPKKKQRNYQKQYESRIHQNEQGLEKLLSQMSDQSKMIKLALNSNALDSRKPKSKPKTKKTPSLSEDVLNVPEESPNQLSLEGEMQNRRKLMLARDKVEKQSKDINREVDSEQLTNMMDRVSKIGTSVDMKELEKYRQKLLMSEMSSKSMKKRMKSEQTRMSMQNKYQDWGKHQLTKLTQSSTYKTFKPNLIVDGNLDTYNQTKMEEKPSWVQIEFSVPIEVRKIVIKNRLGTFNIRDRLTPFNLVIINPNGSRVLIKNFTETYNEYTWPNVNQIAKAVRLEQTELNKLHISGFEVFGKPALKCQEYENLYEEYKNRMDQSLLDSSGYDASLKQDRDNYKALLNSCSKLNPDDQKEKSKLIDVQAKAFDAVLKKGLKKKKEASEKAKKEWKKVEKAIKHEKKVADEAKKLGLPPPPSQYSKAEMDAIKKNIKVKIPKLSKKQKAICMNLLNISMKSKEDAEDAGRKAIFMPLLRPKAERLAKEAESANVKYMKSCPKTVTLEDNADI
jgi:hypothetical protein